MKTRVLLSSIFFIADSVVSGYFRIWYWSSLLTRGTERREYLGSRCSTSVFGRWNLVDLRIFLDLLDLVPVASAFAAFLAFASPACREGGCGSAEWPQEWPRRERGAG